MRTSALVLLICAVGGLAAEPASLAIRNAAVETLGPAGRLERASIVIRDGKIAAVGKDAVVPDDAVVLDAAGGTIMPGLIDPYFEVSIAAGSAEAAPRTVVIRGRTVVMPGGGGPRASGFTCIADNFYPHDAGYRHLARYGLTRLNLVTAGMGQAAVIRVTPDQPEQMLQQPDGIAFAPVSNSSDTLDQIRQRLDGARRSSSSSRSAPGGQLWHDVFEGKTSLVVSAANSAAVVHLLKMMEPYKNVKLVLFMGGESVPETVDALKGRTVKVILRPGIDLEPNSRDRINAARMLSEAGIEFALSLTAKPPSLAASAAAAAFTGDSESPLSIDVDCPLFPVAMLVKTGVGRKQALEALAKQPAAILGLSESHGTIEPGKAADLLLFSGDPLDPASRLVRTIIDGRTVYAN